MLKLCACCLLVAGLCSCNCLEVGGSENNLAAKSVHLSTSDGRMVDDEVMNRVSDLDVEEDGDDENINVLDIKGLRRCGNNLCCKMPAYCCSGPACCKNKRRFPPLPC
ncbi:unnamed protein product [Nezara viridula]|uniref:Neuropeptide n=1 Tax=Nezara viridula TaxID=85310 RepID=A0A9P0H9P7_NEZVI|nr:unnamed protein product [Nezara viridula]